MLHTLIILLVGDQNMLRITYVVAILMALTFSGCASQRGFTFDGIHYIGGSEEYRAAHPLPPTFDDTAQQ